jgi:predicted pyridoxine 5'-phosphate oxidase superfamily flavin-nucleotide-binding protein
MLISASSFSRENIKIDAGRPQVRTGFATGREAAPGANTASPWHEGELALQHQIGVAEKMDSVGRRAIRDHLIEQHRLFYPQLPFVVLGTVDHMGDAWATVRAGWPGFLSAPDASQLDVALPPDPTDPADAGIEYGRGIALLGIQFHTRRRNRLNGSIHRKCSQGFSIAIEQSFGNCPQYVRQREFKFVRDPALPSPLDLVAFPRLEGRAAEMVRTADTFFVASYVTGDNRRHRPDVSHRGGERGFVRIEADGGLTIPDFSGNRFFNTLGNILVNPRAGLVFVDFETGDILQMTGEATVILDAQETARLPGAERLWKFQPRRILYRAQALPVRWTNLPNPTESV